MGFESILAFQACKVSPWAVNMAANNGLASSKVRVERAMKACKKARLLLLY